MSECGKAKLDLLLFALFSCGSIYVDIVELSPRTLDKNWYLMGGPYDKALALMPSFGLHMMEPWALMMAWEVWCLAIMRAHHVEPSFYFKPSCWHEEFHILPSRGLPNVKPSLYHEGSTWRSSHAILRVPHNVALMLAWGVQPRCIWSHA